DMKTRQLLRGPRRIDRRKTLPKALIGPIKPDQEPSDITLRPISSRSIPPETRPIRLQRRPIAPSLIQHIAPQEPTTTPPDASPQIPPPMRRMHIRIHIHRSAKRRSRQDVTI